MFLSWQAIVFASSIISTNCSPFLPNAKPAARELSQPRPTATVESLSLPHRVTWGENKYDGKFKITNKPLNARYSNSGQMKQIPFQFCPEMFGSPPHHAKLCSQCGGASKDRPGKCNDLLVSGDQSYCPYDGPRYACRGYFCKCIDDGPPDKNPQVTMTTVVEGVTGTVVWEPMTLTQYSGLKASTTLTLTETATQSAGSPLETVVALVFAAGVYWGIISQAGAPAAALLIQPPATQPEGSKEDNPSCKKGPPKEECPNCGGADALGLCKSGSEQGCPCDEVQQNCPKDGPPLCSSAQCGGDNGSSQCKADGAIKGCTCCPDQQPDCPAINCGGDSTGKCLSQKLKGCQCEQYFGEADTDSDVLQAVVARSDLSVEAAYAFTNVWSGDLKKVPGYTTTAVTPWCLHGAAPHNTRLPQEYCMCGPNGAIYYSVTTGTNPCPYTGTPGPTVTWTTPVANLPAPLTTSVPPPPVTTTPAPSAVATSKACDPYWCGAPFCGPCPS